MKYFDKESRPLRRNNALSHYALWANVGIS